MFNSSTGQVLGPAIINDDIYFEFTHINGTNNHLVGFSISQSYICLYPQAKSFYGIWTYHENSSFDLINVSIPVQSTVGVGYSTVERKFYAFYNNTIFEYFFQNVSAKTSASPHFWEAKLDFVEDFISINFGEFPFVYQPPGFRSYCYAAMHIIRCTVCVRTENYLNFMFYSVMIII